MGKTDAAYRRLFEHPAMVRDLMACTLSVTLFDALDWDGAQSVQTNHVSDRLKKRSGDIAWLIPHQRRPGDASPLAYLCILLLLEHQSEGGFAGHGWPDRRHAQRSAALSVADALSADAALDEPLPPVNTLEELAMMISEKPGVWAQQWKQEGQASLLLRLIERRFGTIPGDVSQRIHAATESQLTLWSLNLLDADALDEVFRN